VQLETLIVKEAPRQLIVTISRPDHGNSINALLLDELARVLDHAETSRHCRTFVLEGAPGLFCTGMDFAEITENSHQVRTEKIQTSQYMQLLKRFTLSSRIIVCRLDGKVIAGGLGLVAASDIVLSTGQTEFSLSEALWGLLPCCVLPFLIRRVGYQKAYFMTLTAKAVTAAEALTIHLIDELTDDLDDSLRKLTLRLNLLDDRTILDLKHYFQTLSGLTPEIEQFAIDESFRLASQRHVRENIANYVTRGVFPWERSESL
jgi:polyketide biosynthesis enoyl-CoA hydratase PksH